MFKRRARLGLLLILAAVFVAGLNAAAELQVHFLDVGQAECILLQKEDFTLLIDAGDYRRADVVPWLRHFGVESIDLFVLTHPHSDHLGQAVEVLDSFPVEEIWMPGSEHYTRLYEQVIDAVLASTAAYFEPRRGFEHRAHGLILTVLNPEKVVQNQDKAADLHGECLVIRVQYGEISFLFTGDVERKTEIEMIRSGQPLEAQILKLGHHGSRTSTSREFLEEVKPELAVYSAGSCSIYGHPHPEIIDRLKIFEIPVFGTCLHGTVSVRTDGFSYEVLPSRNGNLSHREVPAGYIDINSADRLELQLIVHIGPLRALEITRLRALGLFKDLDDLRRVRGLNDKRIEEIKEQGLACVKE